jgi:PAS domain S-box-containing protein
MVSARYRNRYYRILISGGLVAALITIGLNIVANSTTSSLAIVMVAILTAMLLLSFILHETYTLHMVSVAVFVTAIAVASTTRSSPGFPAIWLYIIPPATFLLLGKRVGILWSVVVFTIFTIGAATYPAQTLQNVELAVAAQQFLLSLGILFLTVYFYEDMTHSYSDKLAEREKALRKTSAELASQTALGNQVGSQKDHIEEKFEQKIKETLRFKQAVESSNDAIIMTNPKGKILYVNSAWEHMTGYKLHEVQGGNPRILKSGVTPDHMYETMWATISKGEPFTTEDIVNKRKDGSLYTARLAIYPVVEEGEVLFFVGMEQDISQRKAVEDAKTEFVALASHQLRTPLSAINWYTELVLDKYAKDSPELKKYLTEIYENNQRMVSIVNALLEMSRLEVGNLDIQKEEVQLDEIVNAIIREFNDQVKEKKLGININVPTGVYYKGDRQLLNMILQNLIDNAIRYTPSEGTISIKISQVQHDLLIEVADTGYGIPVRQQSQIFTKLFRAENIKDKDTQGTGVGLYIVKLIVDKLKGSVSFDSTEGKGSAFRVSLPMNY